MKSFFGLLIVFMCTLGLGPRTVFANDLKVMTYNVLFQFSWELMDQWGIPRWGARKQSVIDFLKEQDADLLGLQELSPFQINDLQNALDHYEGFYFIGPSPVPLLDQYPDAAVLVRRSRFDVLGQGAIWLSDRPTDSYSTSFGNKVPRLIYWTHLKDKITNQIFYFASTHFDNGDGIKERMAMVGATELKKLVRGAPTILVGDFNLSSGHQALLPLEDFFTDACPAAAGDTSHLAGRDVIDHVFVSGMVGKNCSILKPQQRGAPISDHFPVTAILTFSSR